MKAIILSAGYGSRLGNLTKELPKSLVDVNGKSIIERQIEILRNNGIKEIIVIIGANKNKFQLNNVTPIKKIYEILDIKKRISIDDLGYLIGPILNSGGRLSKSNYATELLSTNNEKNMTSIINKLIKLNEQRKKIEQKILEEIDFNKIEKENKKIIIIRNL